MQRFPEGSWKLLGLSISSPLEEIAMTNKRKCSFLKSESGTISIIFALILPVLVAIVGAAVDYGRYTSARARTL